MKTKHFFRNLFGCVFLAAVLILLVAPDTLDARGGRGFGGSRRSFSSPRRSTPRQSYSPRSQSSQRRMSTTPAKQTPSQRAATSFGGKRLSSSRDYTGKYGVPRKSSPRTFRDNNGMSHNYVVHSYGGYGSGLMTGYLMGHTMWYWGMPFHPAFYYSRPYFVDNPDGTVSVYPPTFNWSKLIFTIIIFLVVVYIIYAIIRNRRRKRAEIGSQSSFS